jgi:hypothetical protein
MFGNFGWRMTDMEDLMAVGMLVLAITFNGVLLLLNFWSVNMHEFFGFVQVQNSRIDQCTHVRVTMTNQKQNTVKRFIIPLLVKHSELTAGKPMKANHVEVMKKRFSFSTKDNSFV